VIGAHSKSTKLIQKVQNLNGIAVTAIAGDAQGRNLLLGQIL
jgi:hypothetical protein